MTLLLVESPNKIKKIEHLLGNGYKVEASVGHIMDLNKSFTSYEMNEEFNPTYSVNFDKVNVVKKIKSAAKNATIILIATDEDREGEMIAHNLATVLNLKNAKRIVFNSITKQALTAAIKNPRQIDSNLVNAQKARRILDMMVGFKLSPLLIKNFGQNNLSAGRVQSVVVRLIIDKENEITKFMSEPSKSFFKFKSIFLSEGKPFTANLHDMEGKNSEGFFKGSQSKMENENKARNFLTKCMTAKFKVMHVFDKKKTQGPSPPFTTSTLQQEANRKMGFTGKRTMTAAQNLYAAGYITYMRTDSVCLSEEALEDIQKYVTETYGDDYYRKVEYKAKTKNTQEAHEAIRPTDVYTTEVDNEGRIGYDEQRLYSLIWKRAVASQMKPAEYNVTSIQITISNEPNYFFMTTLENLTFAGFLAVYNITSNNEEKEDDENDDEEKDKDNTESLNKNIKVPKVGTELTVNNINGNQDYLKPPGRYNQASLMDKLDPKNLNIGRPATYVNIIDTILDRNYIKIGDLPGTEFNSLNLSWSPTDAEITEETNIVTLGKEKTKYIPTHLGIMVTYYLIQNFPKIMDYQFTAQMEDKLDDIACGDAVWIDVLKEFYNEINPLVMNINFNKPEIEAKYTKLLGVDPQTGCEIYSTLAKFGPVYKLMVKSGKPKIAPIKEPLTLETATFEDGLKAFEYPKDLGKYNKKKIELQTGQFGFYLIYGTQKISVGDKNNITFAEAVEVIKGKQQSDLGTFTSGTRVYVVLDGKFGKYVKVTDSKTKKDFSVSLPKNEDIPKLTLERINEIISLRFNKNNNDNKNENTKVQKVSSTIPSPNKIISNKTPVKKASVKKASVKKASVKKASVEKVPIEKVPIEKAPIKKANNVINKKVIVKAASKNISVV